jgi:hypothetical protein
MHTIHVINKLDSTHKGPEAQHTDSEEWQQVFLNQGSLDGACGQYCVYMSLIINGIITRSEALSALSDNQKGNTNIGKLASKIKTSNFFDGTFGTDIENIFKGVYSRQVKVEKFSGNGDLRNFVVENVEQDNPVMLAIRWPGGAHWVTVVGLDYSGDSENKDLYRFLVIDPGASNMEFCSWNGVIQAKGSGGKYPYVWWGQDQKVKLDEAVAIKAI